MPLSIGTRLGPYEVVGAIGAGGMGEVYRARDTRLKRDVALKVLPAPFAQDPDRLARFQREAELLATVNHPNIAAVYGLEKADGLTGIALELVEGETLASLIARGPVALSEALSIARQIADALEAAHEKGVVHRDLKPANVALADAGTVKVLDFGLAKALDVSPASSDPSHSPTMTGPALTAMGVILGTAAYMSPEQARGRPADKRSDIWAFGCVLYEMLAGRRAFEGESVTETLAAVLTKEPDWARLPSSTPPAVGTVLRSCLQKDRKQRVRDIGDVSLALQRGFETGPPPAERAAVATPAGWRRAVGGAAALLAAAVVGGTAVWFAMRPADRPVVRTEVTTSGAAALLINGFNRDLAITPDGSRIVYRGQAQLLVRPLDRLEPTVLSGLGLPRGVFTSPDGQWVGFFDGNTVLKKVAITGGAPVTLCTSDGNGSRGATWGPDETIIYATLSPASGLQRVSADGGTPTVLTTADRARGEGDHVWPEFLPGGRSVLFTIMPAAGGLENAQIAVLDIQAGTYKVLLRGGSHAHYVPTGHLVYGAGGTLRAVPFNLARLEVTGSSVVVVDQVVTTSAGAVDMAVAANGTMVYVPGGDVGAAGSLVWVDRAGREEALSAPVRPYTYPRISPDGARVVVDSRDQEQDLWIWDLARQTLTRLTFDPASDSHPVWSPDSQRVIFQSTRSGAPNLFWQLADGTGAVERLSESVNSQRPAAITPDGSRTVVMEITPKMGAELMLMSLQPPRRLQPLIQTTFSERNAALAPDGGWLAYESNETGREEVYVRPFPNVDGGKWQVSAGGGRTPLWSRNGRELFYLSSTNLMMGVQVEPGSLWRHTTPSQILKNQYFESGVGSARTFDIAADGRFLMIKPGGDNAPQSLVVVQNWLEELKRRVPRDR